MADKRFELAYSNDTDNDKWWAVRDGDITLWKEEVVYLLNELYEENRDLKHQLKDCKKLKTKRLNKIRNHRAVIEDLGGSIRAYKGKLSQANEKLNEIQETMEETGALTKSQLEKILND